MHKAPRLLAAVIAASIMAACSNSATGMLPVTGGNAPAAPTAMSPMAKPPTMHSCGVVNRAGFMRCFAQVRTDIVQPFLKGHTTPSGYGPADIQSAYKLPSSTNGSGQTVAIVDAYDYPSAEADLGVYRSQYGLPACTTANGCFKKVSQTGSTSKLPRANAGWAEEEALDIDMVSAVCPNCHIILVEATSATNSNLATAVNEAVALGANVVSNSYGGGESGATNSAYTHPGHVIIASAGDSGTGASQPCSYATVICAGGTNLQRSSTTRGWSETAWTDSGSGCSKYVAKPSYQHDSGCTKRSESDLSAVADPATGVAVYDSYAYQGYKGWMVFGGTSVSSPLLGAAFALAGNASSISNAQGVWAAGGTSALNDVTSGSNGTCSSSYKYICNAGVGYDGPTGNGTPNGLSAL